MQNGCREVDGYVFHEDIGVGVVEGASDGFDGDVGVGVIFDGDGHAVLFAIDNVCGCRGLDVDGNEGDRGAARANALSSGKAATARTTGSAGEGSVRGV